MLDAAVRLQRGELDLDVEVEVDAGGVLALLGPNGAGKTSLVRVLAGLEQVDAGRVRIDGEVVDDPDAARYVPPEERRVGVVFQDHLLFPHLSVLENVAFGLRARGVGPRAARDAARRWLDRVGLAGLERARPGELSGGQAQRTAIARALATDPRLLLLDEPLAALDASVKPVMRRDLRHHLDGFEGAAVVVTHDPLDALALADRVLVLEQGRATQSGTVAEVTARPRTRYVADLLGVNLLRGHAAGREVLLEGGGQVAVADPVDGPTLVLVRPNAVSLHLDRPDTTARNQWACRIRSFDLLGDHVRVHLEGPPDLVAEVTPEAVAALGLVEGRAVWASVKATEVQTYPA